MLISIVNRFLDQKLYVNINALWNNMNMNILLNNINKDAV